MLIKITKLQTEEIELELPAYFSYGGAHVKVLSEKSYIGVNDGSISIGIEHQFNNNITTALFIKEGKQITKLDYETKYNEVLTYLNNQ